MVYFDVFLIVEFDFIFSFIGKVKSLVIFED